MSAVTGTDAVHSRSSEGTGVHKSEDEHHPKCSPFCYAKPAVEKPCTTCCCFCCGLAFFLVLLLILLGAGVEVVRFTSEVPFYLYESTVYKEQTLLTSAYDVANAFLDGELREREQADSDFTLKVIYEYEDGDTLFVAEILEGIKAMEEKIVQVAEYTEYCALNYEFYDASGDEDDLVCVRQASPVNFFDRDWWVPLYNFSGSPKVASDENADVILNQSTIAAPTVDQYYTFANPHDSSFDGTLDLSDDNVDTTNLYWAGYCSSADECPADANGDVSPFALTVDGTDVNVSNQLVPLVDTDWSIQDDDTVGTNAKALRSIFYFGAPQAKDDGELYTLDTEDFEDQRSELGSFLYDEVAGILDDGIGVDGVEVYWDGETNGMLAVYADEVLMSDSVLLIPAVLFIILYLMFQLRSWWLGGVGILMILGNFGPALILYRVLSGYSYFGTLNALSIFLVLGIGADDIFVFANTWKHVRRTDGDLSVETQLRHALATGGKAMLVTSVTTAVSFLINASSGFPAVQSFGIFSALLILTNFCSVVTLYPAATMVYEYYMYDARIKKGVCRDTCHCCKKEKGIPQHLPEANRVTEGDTLVRFFRDKFYPFLHRSRWALLLIYAVIMVVYIIIGSGLEPDTEAPQLLPDSDQYNKVSEKIEDYFSHSDTSALLNVKVPFGIQELDRDDCGGDPCDPTVATDYGAPIWDADVMNITNEDAQRWMLDFCSDLNTDDTIELLSIYEADESNPVPVMCPFQFFKTWCDQGEDRCNQTHPTLDPDDYIVNADEFEETILNFLWDDIPVTSDAVFSSAITNYDVWEDQIRFENTTNGLEFRYMTVEILLDVRFDVDFTDGIDLYNDWKDYVEEWIGKAESYSHEAYIAVDTAFVTDGGGFHWFFLQDKIIQEAFQGIGLSLAGAFIILSIATSNIIVSIMATFCIASMVGGVVFFTVINGWKLGVLEAILFVMVVGFSVDYTIHLSDSYLESEKTKRTDRTREMLATMAPSVLSGAISTIGACFWLLFAYFVFFLKFGTVIFFIIAQSLIFSLFFYAALLDVFGPEQYEWGAKIKKGRHVAVKDADAPTPEDGDKDSHEHLSFGKVTDVNGDMVSVMLEHDGGNITVPSMRVRLRYESGHLVFVQTCTEAIGDLFHRNCRRSGTESASKVGSKKGSKAAAESEQS